MLTSSVNQLKTFFWNIFKYETVFLIKIFSFSLIRENCRCPVYNCKLIYCYGTTKNNFRRHAGEFKKQDEHKSELNKDIFSIHKLKPMYMYLHLVSGRGRRTHHSQDYHSYVRKQKNRFKKRFTKILQNKVETKFRFRNSTLW